MKKITTSLLLGCLALGGLWAAEIHGPSFFTGSGGHGVTVSGQGSNNQLFLRSDQATYGVTVDLSALQTSANRVVHVADSSGTIALSNSAASAVPGYYQSISFPSAYIASCSASDNDLYTVPSGRKAIVFDVVITNLTVSSGTYFPEIKISGTYYRLGNNKTEAASGIGHDYGMSNVNSSNAIVMNAGEAFAVNSNLAAMSVWAVIYEFDATSPMSRASITAWTIGDNALLTVPAGKNAIIGNMSYLAANSPSVAIAGVTYCNGSGGSIDIGSMNAIPNGGSKGTTNEWVGANTISNGNGFTKYFGPGLQAGDSIVINVSAGTAGQFAWCNYLVF